MSKNIIKLKLNRSLGRYKAGDVVSVPVDANNVVMDRYWRRRLQDAKIDNNIEVLQSESSASSKAKPKSKRTKEDC